MFRAGRPQLSKHPHHFEHLIRIFWLILLLVLILLVLTPKANGQPEQDLLAQANDHLYNLEYEEARKDVVSFVATHPEDLQALNLLAVIVVRKEMFRQGLLEASVYGDEGDVYKPEKLKLPQDFEQDLNSLLSRAESEANNRLQKDPKDKDALYWLGVTYGTRGTYDFTLRRAYLDSLSDAKKAVKKHKALLQIDPQYIDAKMIIGVNNYVVGSLPWYWKMMASLAGAHGDRKEGLQQIAEVAEKGNYARDDARFLLALLYSREGRLEDTISILLRLQKEFPRSYLIPQEIGSAYRVRGKWQEAAEIYDDILAKHKAGAPGFTDIALSRIAYLAGLSYAKAGNTNVALLRYDEAAKDGNNVYVYRAELASADLNKKLNRNQVAEEKYRRVANAVPDTPEGKQARKALRTN